MFGLSQKEIIGKHYRPVLGDKTHNRIKKYIQEVLSGTQVQYEDYHSYASGRARWVDAHYVPDIDDNGNAKGFFALITDINERKKAEEALQESEELNRALFEYNPIQTIVADAEGRITRINLAKKNSGDRLPNIGDVMYKDYARKHEINMHAELMKCVKRSKSKHFPKLRYGDKVLSITITPFYQGAIITSLDITEQKQAEEELERSQDQLRSLADHLQNIREDERARIAREIHDEMGQALTGLKMDLSWLAGKVPRDREEFLEKIRAMSELVSATHKTVQRITTELRPGLLDDLGLTAAIEWQTEEFQSRTGIPCKLTVDPEDIVMDEKHSTAFFRIVQESLTNISRHARATRVYVSLKEKDGHITLRVRDNGEGITKEQLSNNTSFGIMGIRERVHQFQGKVRISGSPGQGTTVVVRVPIEEISRKGAKDAK